MVPSLIEMGKDFTVQIADIERIRRILGDEKLIIPGHAWQG